MYLLDTNVVSETRRPRPHGAVLAWLRATPAELLFISAVTIGEIQVGIERTREQDPAKAAELDAWCEQVVRNSTVLPMDAAAFREWARLMHQRSTVLANDAMIAATARVHNLIVVTRNIRDFEGFDVELLNPFDIPQEES